MKYRKRPVVIDAVLWDGKSATIFPFAPFENVTAPPEVAEDKRLHITTLEGVMVAEIGDYVIKGIKGEIYPCKPDIFAQTYELVEAAMPLTLNPSAAWPFPSASSEGSR